MHELRNAAGRASIALHAAEALLQEGDQALALVNLARAREACDRIARMMRDPPAERRAP